ncbi:MAG TPA: Tim44/TimA family putative adaptor protein [Kiloniellaceae bacterium]|nr:Tim44/TimA family putative adaptor protein [Kiloniellaceae bacterium]
MSDGFAFLDIILLAAVAAFFILRLRGVLGKRNGNEKRPDYDPFNAQRKQDAEDKVIHLPNRDKANDAPEGSDEGQESVAPPADGPQTTLSAGLTQIRLADRSFDPNQFVEGARTAFEMIVAAFASGDKDTLKPLLADEVYGDFLRAIEERERKKESLETTLVGIQESEIIEASVQQKTAYVTIKFVSEQINVTRDADGETVDGDPSHVARITDIWTFGRNVRSRDPNWELVATGSPN